MKDNDFFSKDARESEHWQKVSEIEDIFQKFLSVGSKDPEFSAELKKYQEEAGKLLDDLCETRIISEEMGKLADNYSAFLSLLQIHDTESEEWDPIYESLEDTDYYSGKVMRGLRKSIFILPEQDGTTPGNGSDVLIPPAGPSDGNDTKIDNEPGKKDPENTDIPQKTDENLDEDIERKILLSLIGSEPDIAADADLTDLSSSQMAMYLYENNIDPVPAANHELFYSLIYKLIAERNLDNAVLMARALASLDDQPDYSDFCELVTAGCDIKSFPAMYTGAEFQSLYNIIEKRNNRKEDQVIMLAVVIRGLFRPDNETGFTDYQMNDLAAKTAGLDIFPDRKISGNIRKLVEELSDMTVTIPGGFSDEVLNIFMEIRSKEKQENALSEQAKMLMKSPANMINNRTLSEFLRKEFGPTSRMYEMLSLIQQKNHEKENDISSFLKEYIKQYKDFSEDSLKQYSQDLWRDSVGPNQKLKNGGLNNVIRAFYERLELMERWIHMTGLENDSLSDQKKETAAETRMNVLKIIRQLNDDLSDDQLSAPSTLVVLSHALTNIYNMLQTEVNRLEEQLPNNWYQTYYLIFDENGIPICDLGLNRILYCEPWRIVLRHLLSEKLDPDDVVWHIQNDSIESYWADNFGLARWLTGSDEMKELQESASKELVHANFNVYFSEHFEKELEMAVFHGQITENQKDDLMEAESSFRPYFRNNENYGQYRYFLNCLMQRVKIECNILTVEKMAEMDNLPDEIKIERKEDIKKIRQLVFAGNFTAADDKLNRLKNKEDPLWTDGEEKNYFDHFLSVYDEIYRLLRDNGNLEVESFGESILEKKINWEMTLSGAYQRSHRSRKDIFKDWAKENESSVKTLFEELDFPVKSVKQDNDYFVLTAEPSQQNLPEYPHPIAKFGTRMSDKIRVVYTKGVVTANSINTISQRNPIGGTGIIILVDYAIPLNDRRKIVEDFMNSDKEYPFIVIDRVLLFYLAAQVEVNRMQVLLECTLPFSYTQPYVDGKGEVPDEMFFGRHSELTKIRLGTPSCFVYGGRQLGKTALLRRTESLENQPEEKQFAVYFDAKDNNIEKTVSQVAGKLHKLKIIPNQPKTMGDLCSSIGRKLTEGKSIRKLLLLIDEADAYLADDRENDFKATKKLWDLYKEHPNNFKFVFAGLHNVARTAKGSENNSLIGQFNMVSIGQLSKKDAEQLIQKPLRYLGFRMKDEQIASIIENANYYPGVLHYFCHKMLEEVYGNYKNHFSPVKKNPPFTIKEENLKKIIYKANLSQAIRDRLALTLKLDPRYMFFANLIAYLYYTDRENGILNPYGYSLSTIKQNGKEFAPKLGNYDYDQILPEMVEMGILSKEKDNYKLRRACFLEMINDEETVEEYLLSDPIPEEEVKNE